MGRLTAYLPFTLIRMAEKLSITLHDMKLASDLQMLRQQFEAAFVTRTPLSLEWLEQFNQLLVQENPSAQPLTFPPLLTVYCLEEESTGWNTEPTGMAVLTETDAKEYVSERPIHKRSYRKTVVFETLAAAKEYNDARIEALKNKQY